jgi:hypothetical protein
LFVSVSSIYSKEKCSIKDITNGAVDQHMAINKELFYGDWHRTYVPFSSVKSKLFVTIGLNL